MADKNWDDKMVKLAREGDDSAAEALLQKYKTVARRRIIWRVRIETT